MQQIRDTFYGKESNCLKPPEQITSAVCLHAILFIEHGWDKATEKEYETVLHITLEHILTQRFKQSTKWTAKVTNKST